MGKMHRRHTQENKLEACEGRKRTCDERQSLGKQLCPNIHIEFIPKEDIAQQTTFLDAKWENIRALPRTHHIHCVRTHGSDKVKVSDTTDDTDVRNVRYE